MIIYVILIDNFQNAAAAASDWSAKYASSLPAVVSLAYKGGGSICFAVALQKSAWLPLGSLEGNKVVAF